MGTAAVLKVARWRHVDHHRAHALLGFYSSPFRSALILSYDGGGNDGSFHVYAGFGFEVKRLFKLGDNLGASYNTLAALMPEVTGPSHIDVYCANVSEGLMGDANAKQIL